MVFNQNLSIEMFLIRLIHLKSIKNKFINTSETAASNKEKINQTTNLEEKKEEDKDLFGIKDKMETIGQMKSIVQEKNLEMKQNKETNIQTNLINSFDELLKICSLKKEMKLKFELEKNVNLVSFERGRVEISFNENLDKDFIKDLSSKLYEWTNDRWIITLSKTQGLPSKKENEVSLQKELIDDIKKSSTYKDVLKNFPDAEIFQVKNINKEEHND